MVKNIPDFENKFFQGSTLVATAPVSNTENELYNVAVKAISNSEINNIIWICYHKVPRDITAHLRDCGASAKSIGKIHYIDILSNMLGLEQKHENTLYCSSPTEYNCLLRSIDQLKIKGSKNLIIFDNLNALLSYDMIERIIRFIRNLNNLVSTEKDAIMYLSVSGGSCKEVEISIQATMDHVYHLQESDAMVQPTTSWGEFRDTSWKDVVTMNSPIMFMLLIVMMTVNIFMMATLMFLFV
jgi:predicted glycosyltransferase involved in capsule biosynthesis